MGFPYSAAKPGGNEVTGPTTIIELRSSLLQIPWRGAPPAAGVVPPGPRELYVLEIETQGGIVGMSYLHPLRGGLQTIGQRFLLGIQRNDLYARPHLFHDLCVQRNCVAEAVGRFFQVSRLHKEEAQIDQRGGLASPVRQ